MIDRSPIFRMQPDFTALISNHFHTPFGDTVLPLSTPEGVYIGALLSVLLLTFGGMYFIGSRRSKHRENNKLTKANDTPLAWPFLYVNPPKGKSDRDN